MPRNAISKRLLRTTEMRILTCTTLRDRIREDARIREIQNVIRWTRLRRRACKQDGLQKLRKMESRTIPGRTPKCWRLNRNITEEQTYKTRNTVCILSIRRRRGFHSRANYPCGPSQRIERLEFIRNLYNGRWANRRGARRVTSSLDRNSMHESETPIISARGRHRINLRRVSIYQGEPSGCLGVNDALRSFNVVRAIQDEYRQSARYSGAGCVRAPSKCPIGQW